MPNLRSNKKLNCSLVYSIFVAILGLSLLILALIFISFIFLPIFHDKLASKLPIRNGSDTFKNWMKSSVPIYMKFYLYNVTNVEAVLAGERPYLQELGPYTYLEKRQKLSYTFSPDGKTLSYREKKTFIFKADLSVGNPMTDKVTTLNPLVTTLIANIAKHKWVEEVFSYMAFEGLFETRNVNEMLWGYEDPVIKEICDIVGYMCDKTTMGFMVGNNGSVSLVTSINTGIECLSDIGHIVDYNGKSKLSIWTSDIANAINGSDGTMFKPGINESDLAYVFSADVCRSFEFGFVKRVQASNDNRVTLLNFMGTQAQAQNASVNPYNRGFCPKDPVGPECPPGGLMDLSPCRSKGALLVPLFASQPHYYLAEPWVSQPYDGLQAGSERDSTQLNIEPNLGVPLEAYKRLQMNFYLKPDKKLADFFHKMTEEEYFFPLFWLEEGATSDAKTLDKLYNKVLGVVHKVNIIALVIKIIGAVVLGTGLIATLLIIIRIRRNNARNVDQNPADNDNSAKPMLGDDEVQSNQVNV